MPKPKKVVMEYAAVVTLEIIYMIAFLVLISAGLAVIFGMMRVIKILLFILDPCRLNFHLVLLLGTVCERIEKN